MSLDALCLVPADWSVLKKETIVENDRDYKQITYREPLYLGHRVWSFLRSIPWMIVGICSSRCMDRGIRFFHEAFRSREIRVCKNEIVPSGECARDGRTSVGQEEEEGAKALSGVELELDKSSVGIRDIMGDYRRAGYVDDVDDDDDDDDDGVFFYKTIPEKKSVSTLSDEEFIQTVKDFNGYVSKPAGFGNTDYGYIVKEELDEGTRVDFRADFHGDLKSCVDYLESLKTEGILDDNYVVKEEHRGSFKAIFMGDYLDRGGDSKKVLYLLMKFKLANPDNVELLCGNHESATPVFFPCSGVMDVINTVGTEMMNECFQRMPRAYIYGVRAGDSTIEYTHVSHALFDPDVDIEPLLASRERRVTMLLSKKKPYELSDRVKLLIPDGVSRAEDKDFSLPVNPDSDFRVAVMHLENYVRNGSTSTEDVKSMFGKGVVSVSEARLVLNALYVDYFVKELAQKPRDFPSREIDNYTWADVGDFGEGPFTSNPMNSRGSGSELSLGMIRAYTDIMSSPEARLVNFVRGHQHALGVRGGGLVHTLPAAGEVRAYDGRRGDCGDIDFAYSLQLAAKVAEGKLFHMKRVRDTETIIREETRLSFAAVAA